MEEINKSEPINQGVLIMLLVVVRLVGHISVIEHFSEDFLNENFVPSEFEKLCALTKDKQNISWFRSLNAYCQKSVVLSIV